MNVITCLPPPPHPCNPVHTCTYRQPQTSMSFLRKFTWTLLHAPPHPTPPPDVYKTPRPSKGRGPTSLYACVYIYIILYYIYYILIYILYIYIIYIYIYYIHTHIQRSIFAVHLRFAPFFLPVLSFLPRMEAALQLGSRNSVSSDPMTGSMWLGWTAAGGSSFTQPQNGRFLIGLPNYIYIYTYIPTCLHEYLIIKNIYIYIYYIHTHIQRSIFAVHLRFAPFFLPVLSFLPRMEAALQLGNRNSVSSDPMTGSMWLGWTAAGGGSFTQPQNGRFLIGLPNYIYIPTYLHTYMNI